TQRLSSFIDSATPFALKPNKGLTRQGNGHSEELRCVIAVIRHGDRTPKQKVKLNVTEEKLLNLMLKYNGGKPRAETKLKSAVQLHDLLDATRIPGRDPEDREHAEKLRQVKVVLEEQRTFWNGAERKFLMNIQEGSTEAAEAKKKETVEALMILKYGGVLTHAGRNMQKILVDSSDTICIQYFTDEVALNYKLFLGEGTGLLRLHSTYRHDLKIYNSDEGRVELLDLEGQLTPILQGPSMLDGLGTAIIEMEAAKARLNEIVTSGKKIINELLLFIIIVHSSNYQIKYAKGKTKRERHNIK
ncbi:hypothetical protein HID58_092068, partial [Brassica napus]